MERDVKAQQKIIAGLWCMILGVLVYPFMLFFPFISLILLYFVELRILRKLHQLHGAESYGRYKWVWISAYALPYYVTIIIAFFFQLTQPAMNSSMLIEIIFAAYILLIYLFGAHISQKKVAA